MSILIDFLLDFTALAITIKILILIATWFFIRSAVASGTTRGIENAMDNIMDRYRLQIRADENDRIYLAHPKTIHITKDKPNSDS